MINQYSSSSENGLSVLNVGTFMLIVRLFIIVVGLGITLFGIKYSLDVFLTLYAYLQQPETLAPLLEKWITLLNIKDMVDIYPMDKSFAIVILAIGVFLLLRITLGFIHAGISILINASTITTVNSSNISKIALVNLDSKLSKLKMMAEQGVISKQAYEEIRDKYLIEKVMES